MRFTILGPGLALMAFAVAHVAEDFAYGSPEERFGFDPTVAAVGTGVLFAMQAGVMLWAAHGRLGGYVASVVVGVGWALAVGLNHGGEILFAEDYRAGVVSKALEVGTIASGVALAASAALAIAAARRQPRA